jgi:hypothetical protein
MSFAIAMLLRPLALFVLLACVLLPIRFAVMRFAPDGKLKRWLLTPIE